jgi:hypothetical protein
MKILSTNFIRKIKRIRVGKEGISNATKGAWKN